MMAKTLVCAVAITLLAVGALGLNNGLGKTPQMGWNSWNKFQCGINEKLIQATADQIIALGLSQIGYKYVNLDDCWQTARNSTTNEIIPSPTDFPSGIAALADYMHTRGLSFGVYSDAGYKTCAGRPASLGYETVDANTYAKWGVDYLKYDNCNDDGTKPEVRYPPMRNALLVSGRPIFFSMCEWGVDNPATWAPAVGNSWRTTGDIQDNWNSMLQNIENNDLVWKYAAPGGWNDPDMLEIGNGGLTHDEELTHFSLWCIAKAPLLIGCDLTKVSSDSLAILTNTEAIAVNQDSLGVQGHKVWASEEITQFASVSAHSRRHRLRESNLRVNISAQEVWAGPLADGGVAVVLLNTDKAAASITAEWADIGMKGSATVRDIWAHKTLGTYTDSFTATVPSHGVQFLRLTPAASSDDDQ